MTGACTACGATADLNDEGMCPDCSPESAEGADAGDAEEDMDMEMDMGDGDDTLM